LACNAKDFKHAAADGQMGCLIKLYRDWKLSGDGQMLGKLWPNAKKAIEFCWLPGGWDADQDGVMEGCQHNTMDVEYYGPNGQMCCWYLGALRAGEEMGRQVGDIAFADKCRSLFLRGRKWVDENLFNGEYYEQEIRPMKEGTIAEGCRVGAGAKDPANPDWQLGKACLVDQLVGQYLAHTCGLGYLLDPGHVKTTLRSIMRHNFRQIYGHFNNMRSFVLNDEYALLMATYPKGTRPSQPFPYFAEVMTGLEYAAAVGMLYEGLTADGLRAMSAIRSRYDGKKRSPWNEAECGHHYGRAMASWGAIPAWTGFQYSGTEGEMTFAFRKGTWFWSNGSAFGTCRQQSAGRKTSIQLTVIAGALKLSRFTLNGKGSVTFRPTREIEGPGVIRFAV
ncbi:MAG: GH116 family glycosyl hydrolase, partial [bacterium]